jgi:hypothetical protein
MKRQHDAVRCLTGYHFGSVTNRREDNSPPPPLVGLYCGWVPQVVVCGVASATAATTTNDQYPQRQRIQPVQTTILHDHDHKSNDIDDESITTLWWHYQMGIVIGYSIAINHDISVTWNKV